MTRRQFRGSRLALAIAIVCAACHDTSPVAPPAPSPVGVASSLAAVSDTIGTAIAGNQAEPLVVIARSATGSTVAGVVVRFNVSVPRDGAWYTDVTSDAQGKATLRDWVIGISAGTTVVTASTGTLPAVTFRIVAAPGPPSRMSKASGDGQTGAVGDVVSATPRVIVTDAYGNPVAGVEVSFSIQAGNGRLEGPVATTDSAGFAAVGGWQLNSAGRHALAASSAGTNGVVFKAYSFATRVPCGEQNALFEGAVLRAELSDLSCDGDGRRFDEISVIPAGPALYSFILTSAEFNTKLEVRDASNTVVAVNDNVAALSTSSRLLVFLPEKPVTVVASAARSGATGKYSISYEVASAVANGCQEWFAARGISIDRWLDSKPCDSPGERYGDRYKIFLKAGNAVDIAVLDMSYSSWYVSLYDDNGGMVAEGVQGGPYETFIKFKAARDAYYTLKVNSGDDGSQYRLSIQ